MAAPAIQALTNTGQTIISNTSLFEPLSSNAIDRITHAAAQRYFAALEAGTASNSADTIRAYLTLDPVGQGFIVRLADEIDAFTISTHPIEATGYLLWHVRGMLDNPLVIESAAGTVHTDVMRAMSVASALIEEGTMERPFALQHLSTSAFRSFPQ